MIGAILVTVLAAIVAVILIYTIRHYTFTINRLVGQHRQPYVDIGVADWPEVVVLVPAHNEAKVIGGMLDALLEQDYPPDRLTIVPINDRSTDATAAIVDRYAAAHPGRIAPFHRTDGVGGKAAALRDAAANFGGQVHLVFDADYLPGQSLVKQLVAPFFDPEVGAVMGRVVPHNVSRSLLTRLLDLERAGGYQVDQQARMNLRLVPQYGGTVGGVRRAAVEAVGGWSADTLAEDTDMTYRLVLAGWEIVYQNRSECYEEVPENWPTRIRQIMRWTQGHNQSLWRYWWPLLKRPGHLRPGLVLDGLLLLGVFAVGPLLLVGWGVAIALFFMGVIPLHGFVALLGITAYGTLGNFAAFFEVATAARLDGTLGRIRILPFLAFGFLVSLVSVSRATLAQIFLPRPRQPRQWDKTERYRGDNGAAPKVHQ
ncbi:MAG: glycosyltransferase family 2 protein [Gemmatimonadota bacterium]|nr:glycosyltransferase family 2 protein [Gemmatimonadota bacterium]